MSCTVRDRARGLLAVALAAWWVIGPAGGGAVAGWSGLPALQANGAYAVDHIIIRTVAWLGVSPPQGSAGMVPVAASLTNDSEVAITVPIVRGGMAAGRLFRFSGMLPTDRITVPPEATVRTLLLAEPWNEAGSYAADLEIGVDGTGLALSWRPNYRPGVSTATPRVAVISRGVDAVPAAADAGLGSDLVGIVDVAEAPADWRGWTLLTDLAMTADEWTALPATVREAAVHWVALGGRLTIFGSEPPPGVPSAAGTGAGSIECRSYDQPAAERGGVVAPFSQVTAYATNLVPGSVVNVGPRQWLTGFATLADRFGSRGLPVVGLLVFLLVVAVVAGPLNVMVLAAPGRRARLFWTTPAISLVATALLLAMMFLGDGTGGVGARRVTCTLLPEHNAMAIVQEQFSRTGVLATTAFPAAEASWMRQVGPIPSGATCIEDGSGRRHGDWFRSRADQAYVLRAIRPGRGRVDRVGATDDGRPVLVSSVDVRFDTIYVRDAEGRVWRSTDLPPGVRRTCEPATDEDLDGFVSLQKSTCGPIRAAAFEATAGRPGSFVATAGDAAPFAIATLRSIRWQDEQVTFTGPVTAAEGGDRP